MRLFRFQHPSGGHLLPHEPIAIVKPILENRANSKVSMSDCKNVKKIAAILSM